MCALTTAKTQFQHTAARRRLVFTKAGAQVWKVSTHSRPKAAEYKTALIFPFTLFQHTAARRRLAIHTLTSFSKTYLFQHTAARRRLMKSRLRMVMLAVFQHTAARRRLAHHLYIRRALVSVSTHSRPKAAEEHYHRRSRR